MILLSKLWKLCVAQLLLTRHSAKVKYKNGELNITYSGQPFNGEKVLSLEVELISIVLMINNS